ncbi:MAG: PilZ domain-containing protein [Myxococcales bacterium]|nr:PilZ domain-containing protein [Myxococcales bacterium]
MSAERRRDVRLRPSPDLPARASVAVDALVREAVEVVDLSAGGLAFARGDSSLEPGARVELRLALAGAPERSVAVVVRWRSEQTVGAQFVDLSDDAAQELRRYLGELLERGASV